MNTSPYRVSRILLSGLVCLMMVTPVETHSTVVEINAHDVGATVSVDARHANNEAHFEHSAVEVRSACVACTLTQKSEATSLNSVGEHHPLPQIGTQLSAETHRPASRPNRYAPSRAPPLL